MPKTIISKDKLLESGLHYGHQTKSWNPAMKPFIAMSKRNIHIIDLEKTNRSLENSYKIVKKITEKRGTFLFVGTQKQSSQTVKKNAERVGAFYINHRWLGGLLTNFRTIQNSINKLRRLERLEKNNFEGYTKKEGIQMKKELEKLEKSLGGIKFMMRLPNAIFVASIRNEDIAIKEAKKMGIPVFGIADTNIDPYTVNFPIFGNDDANKSVSLITTVIADAIAAANGEEQAVAYVDDEKMKVIGLVEERRKENFFKLDKNKSYDRKIAKSKEPNNNIEKRMNKSKNLINEENNEKIIAKKSLTKQEKMRKNLIEKINSSNIKDTSNIKLIELYGVNSSIEEYFIKLKWDSIYKISNLDLDKITNNKIEALPALKTTKFDNKKQKIKKIINEAKYIVSKIN